MSSGNRDWLKRISVITLLLLAIVFLTYLVVRTSRAGNDINVYLHAAGALLNGLNIYVQNPYNFYLYSPLFALMLAPLTFPDMSVARVLWMLVNVILAVRLWFVLRAMIQNLPISSRRWWSFFVIVLSLGFLNHNFMLGQVTILILCLTIEGLYQVARGKAMTGAILIALGVNIKIIPLLALVYFGMKGHFKALVFTLVFVVLSLFLPGLFVGFGYNAELLSSWKNVINPSGERFAFEDNDGCHSLNAVIPAFFFDFDSIERSIAPYKRNVDYPRRIMHVPYETLSVILLLSRLLVLGIFLLALLPRSWMYGDPKTLIRRFSKTLQREFSRTGEKPIFDSTLFFWEIGMLCLVTLLIFPHQMKYSMLYFVPAGAYLIMCMLPGSQVGHTSIRRVLLILAGVLMLILAIMGREIIGTHLVDVLDYYHFMGIANLGVFGDIVGSEAEGEDGWWMRICSHDDHKDH